MNPLNCDKFWVCPECVRILENTQESVCDVCEDTTSPHFKIKNVSNNKDIEFIKSLQVKLIVIWNYKVK